MIPNFSNHLHSGSKANPTKFVIVLIHSNPRPVQCTPLHFENDCRGEVGLSRRGRFENLDFISVPVSVAIIRGGLSGQWPPRFLTGPLLAPPVLCLISRSSSFDWHAADNFQPAKFQTIWRLSGDGSDDIHKPMLGLIGLTNNKVNESSWFTPNLRFILFSHFKNPKKYSNMR